MCEHCNHERELKVGDRVNVNWQIMVESSYEGRYWVIENMGREDRKQGIVVDIDGVGFFLQYKVEFNDHYVLWLMKDCLSLADESESASTTSKTEKENENMSTKDEITITCEITCEYCGCVIPEGKENKTWDGEYICNDCRDDYDYCEDCGKYVSSDDSIEIYNKDGDLVKTVCPHCADDYPVCVECGEHILPEGLVDTGYGGDPLCEYCAEHSFTWNRCEDCGEFHTDCEIINDECYCQNCAEDHYCDCNNSENSEYVNNYSYKPCPKFHHSALEESDNSFLFMGVELEIDSDDGDANAIECAEDLHNIDCNTDFFYLKHDGSLNQPGIEIVTHPCTLVYHTNVFPWEEIVGTARSNGYSSHDIGTCGLHVHVSRDALGDDSDAQDLTIAKIVIMMDKLWDYLVKFSRRHYNQLHWARKMDASINETDTEEEAVEKTKAAASGERYHALNLQNCNTIEFRLFRGTLKLNTIMATLQFVDGMCRYAMAHTVKECLATSWTDLANSIDYPEFRQYLRERDLTNDEQPEQDDGYDADED